MDLATLIGMLGAFAIVIAAMVVGGDVTIFINIPSLLIVVGGSIFAVLIKFSVKQFLGTMKIAGQAFFVKVDDPLELVNTCTEMAVAARKGGLLSLESIEVDNNFLKKGVQYIVDGLDADVVRNTMMKDMMQTIERHNIGNKIFKAIGDVAPAMGMIGTLIGLVQMLSAMDDPKSVGPAMAVALLTTLYGAMIANMVAIPIADKLELRSKEERRYKSLMIDALVGIQTGQNPRMLEELLKTYLPANLRQSDGDDAEDE